MEDSIDTNIELLAPAGNWEALQGAVENGADAVYLGGRLFSARQQANNFDQEQLKEALDYAHVRGVKIYLAMNTIISDDEMKEALDFAEEIYLMGVDGLIVQDLGLARNIRKFLPDINLHASTQMTIYNLEGVNILAGLGFKRVVLAREISIEEVSYIAKNTSLDIETFVHGALCISYSGQCLMSSIIGGRSGNRGKCAQPCRLPYSIYADNLRMDNDEMINSCKYLLSPKDLSTINILDKIVNSGVKSLKIEGRMKTPEYVATVVRIYRKYLDIVLNQRQKERQAGYRVEDKDIKDLTQIFNRGGFTEGYLREKRGKDIMSYQKPKNWGINIGQVITYNRARRGIKLRLKDNISIGDGIEVWNGENRSPSALVSHILKDDKSVPTAAKGDTVIVGDIRGNITKGDLVYRTSEKRLSINARQSFERKPVKKVIIKGEIAINHGKPISMILKDRDQNVVHFESSYTPETAINISLTKERVKAQLDKTGDTPFEFEEILVDIDPGLSVPAREINSIRREALERMEKSRTEKFYRNKQYINYHVKSEIGLKSFPTGQELEKFKLAVYFFEFDNKFHHRRELEQLDVDRVYLPLRGCLNQEINETINNLKLKDIEVFIWLPAITKGNYHKIIKTELKKVRNMNIDGLMVGNLGSIEYIRDYTDFKLVGDYSLNAFNSHTLEQLQDLGINGITLSPEMTMSQIESIQSNPSLELESMVYGRIPLMISEHCPVGSTLGGLGETSSCSILCKTQFNRLRDRKGLEFPIVCDNIDCRSTILNSNVLFIPDAMEKLSATAVGIGRISIYDEDVSEIKDIISLYRDAIKGQGESSKSHNKLIQQIKLEGFTRGHYYRGV